MNNQELIAEFFKQLEEEEFSKNPPPSCPDSSDPEPPSETTEEEAPAAPADPSQTDFLSALLGWAENRCPDQVWTDLLARKDEPGAPLWLKADALGLDELSHRVLCLALANAIRVEEDLQNAPVPNHAELSLMKTLYAVHIGSPGKRATALVRLTDSLRTDSPLIRLGYLSVDPRLASAGRSDADPMGIGPFLRLKFGLNALVLGRLLGEGTEQTDQKPNLYESMLLPQTVRATLDRLLAHPEILSGGKYRLFLRGPKHFGGRTLAEAIAQRIQQPLKPIKIWDGPQPGNVAYVVTDRSWDEDDLAQMADHPGLIIFRSGEKECRFDMERLCNLTLDLGGLTKGELIMFANHKLKESGGIFQKVNPIDLVGSSGLTPGSLLNAMAKIREEAEWQGHDPDAVPNLLMKAVKRVQGENKSVVESTPKVSMKDLCLDQETKERFQRIIRSIRGRQTMLSQWHLDPELVGKAQGIVLFHGPSGCGKSLGAAVLASELGLDLHTVEASSLESAYVSESETLVRQFFEKAKGKNCVYLVDEISVFDKRDAAVGTTVRYQISLTNQWLRCLQDWEGIIVFTSNHPERMDPAIERRLLHRLKFCEPNAQVRQSIWQNLFDRAPVPGRESLDLLKIAEAYVLSGGRIRNAFMQALQAAAEEGAISQAILKEACREEYQSGLPKTSVSANRPIGFAVAG